MASLALFFTCDNSKMVYTSLAILSVFLANNQYSNISIYATCYKQQETVEICQVDSYSSREMSHSVHILVQFFKNLMGTISKKPCCISKDMTKKEV